MNVDDTLLDPFSQGLLEGVCVDKINSIDSDPRSCISRRIPSSSVRSPSSQRGGSNRALSLIDVGGFDCGPRSAEAAMILITLLTAARETMLLAALLVHWQHSRQEMDSTSRPNQDDCSQHQ